MSEKDTILIAQAKNGEVAAFKRLIEKYQKKIFNIALRMLGNQDDAADLAQEVFIKVYRSLSDFKEESTFSTWIYRITTNVCLDHIRKVKNRTTKSIDQEIKLNGDGVYIQVEDKSPGPDVIIEKKQAERALMNAIESLPPDQRIVVIMRDVQGFSYDEIAQYVNSPSGTVKSRINRARLALREKLLSKMELFREGNVK